MACNIEYKGKLYTEEQAKPIANYHYAIESDLIASGMFEKTGNIINSVEDVSESTYEFIDNTNNKYGQVVAITSDGLVDINVNPISDRILKQREATENVGDLNDATQFRKSYNMQGVDMETLEGYEAKANLMEQRFNELGITTHIVFDGDMQESGALLGTGSDRYQTMLAEGSISQGDAVIVINPKNMFTDTVFHEYGHLFIDLAGGMGNKRIKYAYGKIKNTELAREVREQYPELSGEALEKEIMATALGKEANEIFSNESDVSFFQRFLDWIRTQITNVFGIQTTTVKDLANELLGNKQVSDFTNELNTDTQLQKVGKKKFFKAELNKKLNTAEEAVKKINNRFITSIASVAKSTDETKVAYKKFIQEIQSDVQLAGQISNVNAIAAFIENTSTFADSIEALLSVYSEQIAEGKEITLSKNDLNQMVMFKNLFELVSDVRKIVKSPEFVKDYKAVGYSKEEIEDFETKLGNLVNKADNIKSLHTTIGKHHIANKSVPYSNRMTVERRMELEREEKAKFPIKSGESVKEYNQRIREKVNEQLSKELPELKKQEREYILQRLQESPADLTAFGSLVSSEKDLNSMVVQLASKLLDEADLIRDNKMLSFKLEANKIFQEFDKETSGTDAKNKYKGIYQEGSDGKLYLAGEYSVEWYIKRKELLGKLNDDVLDAKGKTEAWTDLQNFDEENTLKTEKGTIKPTDKWKNKEYSNVMSKPNSGKAKMLQFLIKTSQENSKLLYGNLSLVRSVTNSDINFIQVPSIGKSTFEKATSGNLFRNIQDSFERFTKVKTDEEEFGQGDIETALVEDKDVLRVITDAEGNMRSGVPIHFRGKMDLKDISYDLLSSITIDRYMSLNFNAKSGLQTELELLKDVVAEKTFDASQGFKRLKLFTGLSKEEEIKVKEIAGRDSKEYKVLKSIIENRLYGVKTINSEYAQLAGSIMGWTANSMLMFNIPSAMVNVVQGKVFNFIESVGGEFFSGKDLVAAESLYFRDFHKNMADIGTPVQTSLSNQLMDLFNIQGSMKGLSNKFIENNRVKALFKKNSGYALQHMGEHYMHGTLMFAILNNIKVMNKEGKFVDKEGKVVSKDKAMSLANAITLGKNNELVLNPHVHKTSHGNDVFSLDLKSGKGLLEVKGLINKIAHDLHGNYNDDIQNMAQRYVVGKAIFMLRKWLVPGFNRRWRGAAYGLKTPIDERREQDVMYSEDLQGFQEGYYVTGIRFLINLSQSLKTMQFDMMRKNWADLSDMERSNIRRFAIETGTILASLAGSLLLAMLAEGMGEDEPEREALFYAAYVTRRIYAELFTYSNPMEAFKILKSPAASMNYIVKLGMFADQIIADTWNVMTGEGLELYQSGRHKDTPKLYKRTADITPGWAQRNRDIEESYSYLKNLY